MSDFNGLSNASLRDRKNYFNAKLTDLIERRRTYEARMSDIKSRLERRDYSAFSQLRKERAHIAGILPEIERAIIETKADIKEINILLNSKIHRPHNSSIFPKLHGLLNWLREINRTEKRDAVRELSIEVTKKLSGIINE